MSTTHAQMNQFFTETETHIVLRKEDEMLNLLNMLNDPAKLSHAEYLSRLLLAASRAHFEANPLKQAA